MHAARGTNRRNLISLYSHRAATSSGRYGGMAHMTGALRNDADALGTASWDSELEGGQSCSLHESRRNA